MKMWKGPRSSCRPWREMGTGSVGDPTERASTGSWRKCNSWMSSARTGLCCYYWPRQQIGVTEPPRKEFGQCLSFSLFCYTPEAPSLMLLTHGPEQQLGREAKEAEVSSHPFNPTTSLFTSSHAFPLLTVLDQSSSGFFTLPECYFSQRHVPSHALCDAAALLDLWSFFTWKKLQRASEGVY